MRVFKGFNQSGNSICPVCKTNEDKETVLIPIFETFKDHIAEAFQIHLDCLKLISIENRDGGRMIYQIIDSEYKK